MPVLPHGVIPAGAFMLMHSRSPRHGGMEQVLLASIPTRLIALADHRAALADAFDRCAQALYRYFAVRLGHERSLADDFMQQLWLQAQRLSPTEPDEFEFRLRAVARNLVRTHWRRTARRPITVPLADPALATALAEQLVSTELPDDVLARREVRDQLLLALTELPAAQQDLLVEHYFAERSHAELARRLGTTPRAVEGRLYRARQALRDALQKVEPF